MKKYIQFSPILPKKKYADEQLNTRLDHPGDTDGAWKRSPRHHISDTRRGLYQNYSAWTGTYIVSMEQVMGTYEISHLTGTITEP